MRAPARAAALCAVLSLATACSSTPPDVAAAGPAVSPPQMAQGAYQQEGLGDYSFPVTSGHPGVERWFDQGLALTYGFNHDAAERAFIKATELDPKP